MTALSGLSEREKAFLDAVFDPVRNPKNDLNKAKTLAGYPEDVSLVSIIRNIKLCLQEDVQSFLLTKAIRASQVLEEIMNDENPLPGSDKVIQAALQILDRAGITKKDKSEINIKAPDGVVILPPLKLPSE